MDKERRMGPGDEQSRPNPELGFRSETPGNAVCCVSSLLCVAVDTGGASGGHSRVGGPEQLGPWQGEFGGVGVSLPIGELTRPLSVLGRWADLSEPLRMVT
jgi:hypothetical protein